MNNSQYDHGYPICDDEKLKIYDDEKVDDDDINIYPPREFIFRAFELCPFEHLKVVIIGQDPYHGPNQANGLCFSVNVGCKHPPSLRNIITEINTNEGCDTLNDGDFTHIAKRGVLFLNCALTVKQGKPLSHMKHWESYTDSIIQHISDEKDKVIFLLWGGYAKSKKKFIDVNKHVILESGHPSPMSANRGYWFGNKHFQKVNELCGEKIF